MARTGGRVYVVRVLPGGDGTGWTGIPHTGLALADRYDSCSVLIAAVLLLVGIMISSVMLYGACGWGLIPTALILCKNLGQVLNPHRLCTPNSIGYQVEWKLVLCDWLQLQKIALYSPQGDEHKIVSSNTWGGLMPCPLNPWGYLGYKHAPLPFMQTILSWELIYFTSFGERN